MTENLTQKEKSWLRRMQKLLDQCPSHFEFNTIGDCDVTVYDNRLKEKIEAIFEKGGEYCTALEDAGAIVGYLNFPNNVHSTAG